MSRVAAVPLFIWMLNRHCTWFTHPGERELWAAGLFIAASITDGIDGYLARRWNQVTTLGMLLDPLADKLMVAGAFIALVEFNPLIVPAWIAVLVIGREFLVSGLRSIAASEGFTIEASDLGKLKTVIQIVAIVAAVIQHHWEQVAIPGTSWWLNAEFIARTAMWFMVAVSLISAADYFIGFWMKIDRSAQRTRKKRFILSRRKKHDMQTQTAAGDNKL